MEAKELYDIDFVAWTERQAPALRRSPGGSNSLDIDRLAAGIEDLGKRDIWREAIRAFAAWSSTGKRHGSLHVAAVLGPCPVSLDDLVVSDFDDGAFLDRIRALPIRSAIDGGELDEAL